MDIVCNPPLYGNLTYRLNDTWERIAILGLEFRRLYVDPTSAENVGFLMREAPLCRISERSRMRYYTLRDFFEMAYNTILQKRHPPPRQGVLKIELLLSISHVELTNGSFIYVSEHDTFYHCTFASEFARELASF